jgi:hypothetical protein
MARGPGEEDSVYDFLYIDARRLAHFLSQFSDYGHLTALTRSVNETSTSSGGVNVHIAKVDTGTSAQTSQVSQFDAQWIAPLTFLDQANSRGMIARGIEEARVGRLVLVSGELAVFDLAIMQSAWSLNFIKRLLVDATRHGDGQPAPRHERRRQERGGDAAPQPPAEAALELLKLLPHRIIAATRTNGQSVWCNLREDALTIPASDLLLKHGAAISGTWSTVGVVDALPDTEDETQAYQLSQMNAAMSLGSLGGVIGNLAPGVRAMLGRPKEAFVMTPLLIFREVSGG